ncbi:hypothetical protein EDB86DRAFT_2829462 [Lactarius hatsudake]|nr:hypothetical protein EDB86DRAFT_2829462 [Lactarius hatsudake]
MVVLKKTKMAILILAGFQAPLQTILANSCPLPGRDVTPGSPGSVSSFDEIVQEADRLLDDWLTHKVHLTSEATLENRRAFSVNHISHIQIWELACWLHLAPVPQVDTFVHHVFPSLNLLHGIQHAFATHLTHLCDNYDWHSPYASHVATYIARHLEPVNQASLERAHLLNTQDLLWEAAPTPVLMASLPWAISISEDSVEAISAWDFQGPIHTPSQLRCHWPLSRRPSVSNLAATPGTLDDSSNSSLSRDSTPVASPVSQNFRGRPIPWDVSTCHISSFDALARDRGNARVCHPHGKADNLRPSVSSLYLPLNLELFIPLFTPQCALRDPSSHCDLSSTIVMLLRQLSARDTASNPLVVDTLTVTWEGGTQTQEARATLAELHELASIPHFPREILEGLPQGPNVETEALANLQNPQHLSYGFYLQNADLTPLKEGVQVGSKEGLNVAFHVVAAALSLGLDQAGEPQLRVLSSNDWYRGASVTLSATLQGVLASSNFHAQGDFPLTPCPDRFTLAEGLPVPHTQHSLLLEMCAQLIDELGVTGDARTNRRDLWAEVRAQECTSMEEAVQAELAPQVKEWKKGMWARLQNLAVDDGFTFLIDALQAEGTSMSMEAMVAEALHAESLLWRQQWEHENEDCLMEKKEAWKITALTELEASAWAQAAREWQEWREMELATAKKAAMDRVSLEDILTHCGSDAAHLIEEKKRFTREYVTSHYQDWVHEEQSRIWLDIEDMAQKSSRNEYLWEEKDRIFLDVRTEVKIQLNNYHRTMIEAGQKKVQAELAKECHLSELKHDAAPTAPKKNKKKMPKPMDTTPDSVIKVDSDSEGEMRVANRPLVAGQPGGGQALQGGYLNPLPCQRHGGRSLPTPGSTYPRTCCLVPCTRPTARTNGAYAHGIDHLHRLAGQSC